MPETVINEATLLEFAKRNNLKTEQIGTTLFGRGIHIIDKPGRSDLPPILITSGSHATEPAGILGALEMARTIDIDRRVVILPIRDPLGWEGYANYLSLASGQEITLEDDTDLHALLPSLGEVIYQDEDITVVLVGEVSFLAMSVQKSGRGPMDIWKHLHGLIDRDPSVVQRLQNRRLILPENLPDVDGCGMYKHAFTAWVTPEGGVANFNRMFSYPDAPTEVAVLAKLVRDIRPSLVVDMHESQGERYSIFAHPEVRPGTSEVFFGATGAVFAAGYEIEKLENLIPIIGADHAAKFVDEGGGVLTGFNEFPGQGWQFTHLCEEEIGAITVTPETGRWQPLEKRVHQQVLSARGAIFGHIAPRKHA